MDNSPADLIARAVLYEGYILYPYRASALKNRQRGTFGGLAPLAGLRTECLVKGDAETVVDVTLRFLHLFARTRNGSPPWQEATEREASLPPAFLDAMRALPWREAFAFPASHSVKIHQHAVEGSIELSAPRLPD